MVPAHVWCLLLFSLVLLAGFCFLLFAFAPCFLLPSFCFCCFCFLLSALYRFCFLLVAFGFKLFAFCVLFLLSAFCFLRFAFCFYVFWTESKKGCNKTIAITTATITVTLTEDSHYSNFYNIFIVTYTVLLRVPLLRVVFLLLMNEHQETTNAHRKEEKTNEHQEKHQRINAATCSIRERTRLQLV